MRKVERPAFLDPYFDPVVKRRLRQHGMNHVPIPKTIQWKALVLAMRSGEWVTIAYLEKHTGFKRKRIRNLLKQGLAAGVIEKDVERYSVVNAKNRWGDSFRMGVPLPRKVNFYRMDLSKLNIEVKE